MTVLSCLLGLVLRSKPDPQLPLVFEDAGSTLSHLTSELHELTGWDFELSPEAANEVVVVRAAGQTARDVFGKVAEASYTKWEFLDDRVRVGLDKERRAEARNETFRKRVDERLHNIRATIKYLERPQEVENVEDETDAETDISFTRRKFFASLLRTVSRADVEAAVGSKRAVLSVRPNSFQRQLGEFPASQANSVIADLAVEKAENERDYPPEDFKEIEELRSVGGFAPDSGTGLSLQTHKLQLVLLFDIVWNDGFVVQMTDSNGVATVVGGFWIGDWDDTKRESDITVVGKDGQTPEFVETWPAEVRSEKMTFSHEADLWWEFSRSWMSNKSTVLPETEELLKKPTVFEPIRYRSGEAILALAKASGHPVAAFLGDWEMPVSKPETLEDVVADVWGQAAPEEGGWMSLSDPKDLDFVRTDRREVEDVIASKKEGFSIPLDAYSSYLYSCLGDESRLFSPSVAYFYPGWLGNTGMNGNPVGVVAYGAMDVAQRQRLWRGGRIMVSELPKRAGDYLLDQLLNDYTLCKLDLSESRSTFYRTTAQMIVGKSDYPLSLEWEPTEFAEAFRQSGFVQGQVGSEQLVMAAKDDNSGLMAGIWGAESFGGVLHSSSLKTNTGSSRATRSRYRLGKGRTMNLMVHLGGGLGDFWPMMEVFSVDMNTAYNEKTLPQGFTDEALGYFDDYVKSRYGKFWNEDE